ncbi:hypothetical protein A3G67_03870 [Candidatus Roizmanbacteria bacterium RIFCSPLOWO2_12_FULL_40_12]|uniref:N-acetyltransferase domain-containing protein n=1 Tax=Candidatus Roizmanbacteria bacterium RIFCSPLOWO2_01_FULL_40_42 TaxID=1802066 RepID=A0A1F7J5T7_9BACT|nr:MAG: hypothetical protein A2779_03505 [Candidatus Roizmanbacteria bacterium RIFCSPHIGHO2_01_FULL_40_98]OGK28401.1 MAG: hypothetical protein A3C31_00870 [Candidatus Roizmanbacteria bacterium RIFCSPHIGHO2_02_FULL_40_53]OGK30637.1 MAG: hypothetical protein A2W49_03555 [Candidatus Roizmanbacteria bacterium RIFCSPHIGHO2_12_41_18]OGK35965.1 MAG: hypothetical protein A3E69_03240 [Candidatus Roizmanbacteria bacterium RIFCSPHIGHO2_12_FULL_40_130]OGK50957.1 MAG: hypothetical protein A3B50_01640 [Candi
MKNPKLVEPDIKYQQSYLEALNEYQDGGRFGDLPLDFIKRNFETYLDYLKGRKYGKGLPEGWVAETGYWLIDENEVIGLLRIRHELTDELKKDGGHIGYDIRPSKRKQGYGKKILELGLIRAKELGIKKALITCNFDNPASKKIIEANGGKFENKVEIGQGKPAKLRYWISVA